MTIQTGDNSVLPTVVTDSQIQKQQATSDSEDIKRHLTPCVDRIP